MVKRTSDPEARLDRVTMLELPAPTHLEPTVGTRRRRDPTAT